MDAPHDQVKYTSRYRSNDSRSSEKGTPGVFQAPNPLIMSLDFFLLNMLHLNESVHLALESTESQEQLIVHAATTLTAALMM